MVTIVNLLLTSYYFLLLSNSGLHSHTSLNFGAILVAILSGNRVTKVQNIIQRWYSASLDMDHSGKGTECVPSALLLKL